MVNKLLTYGKNKLNVRGGRLHRKHHIHDIGHHTTTMNMHGGSIVSNYIKPRLHGFQKKLVSL